MFRVSMLNKIATVGLDKLPREEFDVANDLSNPEAILVRSAKMHDMELPESLLAIARAGAGTNNIPVEACSERGIVVFNTPGANANAVKELVIASLFLASRKLYRGMKWADSLADKGDEIPKLVEQGKKDYVGNEIKGKKLGVIGLGAIGVSIANDAVALGMEVVGFDPFISVEAAWGLSRAVKRAKSLDALLSDVDFITVHVPLNDKTAGLINAEKLAIMKKGVKVLNFARGGIINNKDMIEAVRRGDVDRYITDFPEQELINEDNIICIPHLGASTPEAEENCAVMAANQVSDYLKYGNIKNSVNFPACELPFNPENIRITIINKNVPNMVGQITTLLAAKGVNIADMINKHRGDYAYNIIDIAGDVPEDMEEELKKIDGIVYARVIR